MVWKQIYQLGTFKYSGGPETNIWPKPEVIPDPGTWVDQQFFQEYWLMDKEVCNGGVACSLLNLGSLEKPVIASLFHSGLHSSSPFFVEKTTLHDLLPS